MTTIEKDMRHNVKEVRKSKVVIDPRERIGRAMSGSKGKILPDEQRANISKAWKQAIAGDKFIYHNNDLCIGDKQ